MLWWISEPMGVGRDALLPLQLFTHAGGGSALFHTTARNVINISSGNVCSPPSDTVSYLHAWTNMEISQGAWARSQSVLRGRMWSFLLWNNERIHAMSHPAVSYLSRVLVFWPLDRFISSHLEETEGYTIGDQLCSSHLNTVLLSHSVSCRRIMFSTPGAVSWISQRTGGQRRRG